FQITTAVLVGVGAIGIGAGALRISYPHPLQPQPRRDDGAPKKGDETTANAVLDKAISAIGGEAKLKTATPLNWKAWGTNVNDGNESQFANESTVQGIGQLRMAWDEQIDGNQVRGLTVLNGDKGWRKVGNDIQALTGDALANHKRNLYLLVVPVTLVPL